MGDRSVLEPTKVVPSRDITPGRRKEPLNRRWPNETSSTLCGFALAKGNLPN